MRPLFEEMKAYAMYWQPAFSSKSLIVRAISYFLKNYDEFVFFTNSGTARTPSKAQKPPPYTSR